MRAARGFFRLPFVPLYEYVCNRCQHAFEDLVFGNVDPPCPKCASPEVARTLSVFAVGKTAGAQEAKPMPCAGCKDPGRCGLS